MQKITDIINAVLGITIIILLIMLNINIYNNTKAIKENSYLQEQIFKTIINVEEYTSELGAQAVRTTANSLAKGIVIADPLKIEMTKRACFRDITYDIAPEACDCVISTDGNGDITDECKIFAEKKDGKNER